MVKKNGFTLIEMIIALAIITVLTISMVGIFNIAQPVGKARDAQRKKDLNRIKEAFEEYYNDKGTYPIDIDNWNIKTNCLSDSAFKPYLVPWPCDPTGNPYKIMVEDKNSFRILVNLENKNDNGVPDNWYERKDFMLQGMSNYDINYGVSSSNIKWYEMVINSDCNTLVCLSNQGGGCGMASSGCLGGYCYYYDNSSPGSCTTKCKASCCGKGCN